MDDYEKWKQELHSKSVDELKTLITGYGNVIKLLTAKKYAIEEQLDMLHNQAPTVRRMYVLKVREANAEQQKKTL